MLKGKTILPCTSTVQTATVSSGVYVQQRKQQLNHTAVCPFNVQQHVFARCAVPLSLTAVGRLLCMVPCTRCAARKRRETRQRRRQPRTRLASLGTLGCGGCLTPGNEDSRHAAREQLKRLQLR
jgi:hypothetical protein